MAPLEIHDVSKSPSCLPQSADERGMLTPEILQKSASQCQLATIAEEQEEAYVYANCDDEAEYLALELMHYLPPEKADKLLRNLAEREQAVQELQLRNRQLQSSCRLVFLNQQLRKSESADCCDMGKGSPTDSEPEWAPFQHSNPNIASEPETMSSAAQSGQAAPLKNHFPGIMLSSLAPRDFATEISEDIKLDAGCKNSVPQLRSELVSPAEVAWDVGYHLLAKPVGNTIGVVADLVCDTAHIADDYVARPTIDALSALGKGWWSVTKLKDSQA